MKRPIFLHAVNYVVKEKASFFSIVEKIGEISDDFNDRFIDFDLLKAKVKLFNNLIKVEVEYLTLLRLGGLIVPAVLNYCVLLKNYSQEFFSNFMTFPEFYSSQSWCNF